MLYKDKPVRSFEWKFHGVLLGILVTATLFLFFIPVRPGLLSTQDTGLGGSGAPAGPPPLPVAAAAPSAKKPAAPEPEPEPALTETHAKCYQSSEYAEICVYDLLCFDGDKAVIVSSTQEDWSQVQHHFQVGDVAAGSHTFDVFPRPPPKSTFMPVNTRLRAYYRHPSTLFDGLTPIDWVDEAMWIVEPEYRSWELQHIFFWAHSVFGLWEARVGNSSWNFEIPPLDEVWILKPRSIVLNEWNAASLKLITEGYNTKVKDLGDKGDLSPQHLRCARTGAIAGEKSNIFSGIRGAVMFRKAAYAMLGLEVPASPPRRLIIFNREGAGRAFENIAAMIAIVEKYHVAYEVIKSHGTFEQQVKIMSRAGVLVMAHGAAATNTIFQAHRSVLIEVFPYMRKRFGFMQAATAAGQFYMPIFSYEKPLTGDATTNSTDWERDCEKVSAIQTNHIRTCDLAQKVARIRMPLHTFERTVVDAFDTIGYRIDLPE